jgi:hypothetical protein
MGVDDPRTAPNGRCTGAERRTTTPNDDAERRRRTTTPNDPHEESPGSLQGSLPHLRDGTPKRLQ